MPCDLAGITASSAADTCLMCTTATAIGRDAPYSAPYYHATLGTRQFNVSPSGPTLLLERQRDRAIDSRTARNPTALEWVCKTHRGREGDATETNMLWGIPQSAICVQSSDDSLNSAIRTAYRISLRSSSLREPRYPSLGVLVGCVVLSNSAHQPLREEACRAAAALNLRSVVPYIRGEKVNRWETSQCSRGVDIVSHKRDEMW